MSTKRLVVQKKGFVLNTKLYFTRSFVTKEIQQCRYIIQFIIILKIRNIQCGENKNVHACGINISIQTVQILTLIILFEKYFILF